MPRPERRRRAGLSALAVCGLLAGACGSAAPASTGSRTSTTAPSGPVTVGPAANGHTVRVHVGERVLVRLDALGWTFSPVEGRVLRADGPPTRFVRVNGCRAPQGCGSVQLSLTALSPGRSGVHALRGLCGEDAVCPPGRRKFAVTVVVS